MNTIKVSDIIIPEEFKNSQPSEEKMAKVRKYIAEHGNFDKPIVLIGNTLIDGYIRYLIAIEFDIEEIEFKRIKNWRGKTIKEELPMKYIVGKFENCEKKYVKNVVLVVTVVEIFESNNQELLKHKNVIKKI